MERCRHGNEGCEAPTWQFRALNRAATPAITGGRRARCQAHRDSHPESRLTNAVLTTFAPQSIYSCAPLQPSDHPIHSSCASCDAVSKGCTVSPSRAGFHSRLHKTPRSEVHRPAGFSVAIKHILVISQLRHAHRVAARIWSMCCHDSRCFQILEDLFLA